MSAFERLRVPLDSDYVSRVGAAVYVYARYEWVVIYLIDALEPGYVDRCARGKPIMSGNVVKRLRLHADRLAEPGLAMVAASFERLTEERNTLVHAHPLTTPEGEQRLSYQGHAGKQISDRLWSMQAVDALIIELDAAACEASDVMHRWRDSPR